MSAGSSSRHVSPFADLDDSPEDTIDKRQKLCLPLLSQIPAGPEVYLTPIREAKQQDDVSVTQEVGSLSSSETEAEAECPKPVDEFRTRGK